jgi:transposase InsO family protein
MFVAHYGVAFAVEMRRNKIPLWVLFVAVQLLDFLWAPFVLLGIEKVRFVPGITATNALDLYYMPYTHSLIGALFWSAAAFAIYKIGWRNIASNSVWVTDVTCVLTAQGWLYLVAVLDIFSRRVIGWAMSQLLDTALTSAALRMAINQRHYSQNLIVHSDRGAQFASAAYRQLLSQHGLTASMSRKGNCYDNAFIESFFSSLKYELVYHHRFANARASPHGHLRLHRNLL